MIEKGLERIIIETGLERIRKTYTFRFSLSQIFMSKIFPLINMNNTKFFLSLILII